MSLRSVKMVCTNCSAHGHNIRTCTALKKTISRSSTPRAPPSGSVVKGSDLTIRNFTLQAVRIAMLSAFIHNAVQLIPEFRPMKQERRREGGYYCTHCDKVVPHLTRAHVGMSVQKMIADGNREHPTMPVEELGIIIWERHRSPDMTFLLCCPPCNTLLEAGYPTAETV